MSETAAIRYLVSRGWLIVEDGWFKLLGSHDHPVCLDTAYHLQRAKEGVAA